MKIHSVVACCNNKGIGKNGSLPWKLKKEMKYFQKLSKGNPPEGKQNAILCGRKTWDSFPHGRALPGRYNFVLSRTLKEPQKGMDGLVNSLEEFLKMISSDKWSSKIHEVYNIGGAEIYKVTFEETSLPGRLYLTRIKSDYDCDTFLPSLEGSGFKLLERYPDDVVSRLPSGVQTEDDGTEWFVEVYERSSHHAGS